MTTKFLFWRTIMTDSESPDGIAPICPTHPLDRDLVTDCCPEPQVEVHDTRLAAHMMTVLNDASAKYLGGLRNCPKTEDRLHCEHYRDGDGPCCRCNAPNWLPEGGL